MKHSIWALVLFSGCLFAQNSQNNQQVTVSASVPPPVSVNASYHGIAGQASIYYYVCARFVSGYVCQTQPAVAGRTTGIGGLGGGNSVTVSWTTSAGATGYDVMRFAVPGFNLPCSSCSIAQNVQGSSFVDSSAAAPSFSFPPGGLLPVQPASGQIGLDNLDYSSPGLYWSISGIRFPFLLLPQGAVPGHCIQYSANPPFTADSGFSCGSGGSGINQLTQDVLAGPGVGSQAATVDGLQGVPIYSALPTSGQLLGYDGTAWGPVDGSGITGSGTAGQLALWSATSTLTNSVCADSGTAFTCPEPVGSTGAGVGILQLDDSTPSVMQFEAPATWAVPSTGQAVVCGTGSTTLKCVLAFSSITSGINQLTGDGTAGPGSGSQALTLATVNSGPGTCGDATHVCQVTVNGKGLTTAQTATAITGLGINQLTGDGTAGPGTGSQALTLATVNTGPGTCGDATHVCQVTVNGKGLTTAQTAVPITSNANFNGYGMWTLTVPSLSNWINQGSATTVTGTHFQSILAPVASGHSLRVLNAPCNSGSAWTQMNSLVVVSCEAQVQNCYGGIEVDDGTALVILGYNINGSSSSLFTNTCSNATTCSGASSTGLNASPIGPPIWLAFGYNGTNLTGYYSYDGAGVPGTSGGWFAFTSIPVSGNLSAVTNCGFWANSTDNSHTSSTTALDLSFGSLVAQ